MVTTLRMTAADAHASFRPFDRMIARSTAPRLTHAAVRTSVSVVRVRLSRSASRLVPAWSCGQMVRQTPARMIVAATIQPAIGTNTGSSTTASGLAAARPTTAAARHRRADSTVGSRAAIAGAVRAACLTVAT
jgi:hypothetical protein